MSKQKKKQLKGKNKFIRLEEANLKYVVEASKALKVSQNWVINNAISHFRINK